MAIIRDQITYYFGAGASFNAIPCVDGLKYRLNDLLIFLKDYKIALEYNGNHVDRPNNIQITLDDIERGFTLDIINEILDDIDWLINESSNHQTIDTLAKRLSITDELDDLIKLKRVLIVYFFFEQNISIPRNFEHEKYKHFHNDFLDKRYDNLIASIADRDKDGVYLNKRINIISWNYDLQLECAIKNYFPNDYYTINQIQKNNQIIPNVFQDYKYNLDKFGIIKLNGTAFLSSFSNNANTETIYDYRFKYKLSNNDVFVLEFFKYLNKAIKFTPSFDFINFAWENATKNENKLLINNAIEVMKRTRILVIVGYSFPFFNSKIDSDILRNCQPVEVIIEDNDPELIKERLESLVPRTSYNLMKSKINTSKPSGTFFIHPDT